MSMERDRHDRFRTQPVPLTWEIPALIAAAALVLVALTPLLVQSLVCWTLGGGFVWPRDLRAALTAIGHGEFGAGLRPRPAHALPPTPVMWVASAAGEVLVLSAGIVLGVRLRSLIGRSPGHGLATARQAAEALGCRRLRRDAAVIRPDLYPRHYGRPLAGKFRKGSRP